MRKKFWLRGLVLLSLSSFSRAEQAWIQGLPKEPNPRGIPIQVMKIFNPSLASVKSVGRFTVVFQKKAGVSNKLIDLANSGQQLDELTLVVRTDPKLKNDVIYKFVDVKIEIGKSDSGPQFEEINLVFNKFVRTTGMGYNPGPPPNAPPIQKEGVNQGWIYGLSQGESEPKAIAVIAFRGPNNKGQLRVSVLKNDDLLRKLQSLVQSNNPIKLLILVLPDKASGQYVEYKLWSAKISSVKPRKFASNSGKYSAHEIVFESDGIECLTGTALQQK